MGKKQKKKQKGRAAAAAELTREEAREELLALEAIFGEDITLREDGASLGFALRVVPHPGEAAANYVAVTLVVSFPDDYPGEELSLKLSDAANLAEPAVRQLSKQLHQAASQYAADAEVCCFQLITLAQEFLQQHNCPPEEEGEAGPAAPQSLWHEMQQRDLAAAAESHEQSFRAPIMGDIFFDTLDGGGLFSDAADLPVPAASGAVPPATAAVPIVEVRSSKAPRPPKPPKPPARPAGVGAAAGAAPVVEPSRAGAASATAAPSQRASPTAAAAAAAAAAATPFAAGDGADLSAPSISAAPTVSAPSGRQAGLTGGPGSSRGAGLELASATSVGGGGSIMKTLGASIRGMLPRALRRYLDGGPGATPEGSEAGEAAGLGSLAEEDRAVIRQELFLGHLLTLAASSGAVPPHALPSIAAQLQGEGLVPKWLAFTLTQQPALFDRAFQRVFHQELEAARQLGDEEDDPMAWAVARFWKRRAAPLMPSRGVGHLRSRSGMLSDDSLPSSRYETDFTELRALGRGGYGVVVSAINKMDGRQYAVKKIPLDAHSAGAYARIMREVTTLSRLQHINVVRYFQAWVEASTAVPGDSEDSELDEWGSGSITPASPLAGGAALPYGSGGSGARGGAGGLPSWQGQLAPVAEVSREGRASTPSKTRYGPLARARGGAGSSSGGSRSESEEPSSSSSGGGGSEEESDASRSREASASFASGFGGNMAVVGANQLLASHGSVDSPGTSRPQSSMDGGGFLSAWDTQSGSQSASQSASQSQSRSGTLSSSAGGQAGARGAYGGANGRRGGRPAFGAPASAGSSDFTFDRSRPPHGGLSGTGTGTGTTHPSRPGGRRTVQQVLFIQMEFCPRTLRDVLDRRELDEERRWSILRQILSGLAHIHSQGIIHRDLKPANTFLDSQGNVKLGDFGLAKYNTDGGETEPSPSMHAGGAGPAAASTLFSDTTGLVGTSYYISPEIREGWASYDAKVDLFSLGVMAFELWHPFATAMERAVLLRDLRENGVMPAQFEADHPVVCKLIRWLLAPNPAERPTAVEVLRSELLPPQVLDEQLTDLLRCLPDNPAMHEKVLDAIFSLPGDAGRGAGAAAAIEAPGAPIPVQMAARDHVLSVLRDCFQRHGAVGMCSQELGLASGDDPPGAVHLLTAAGTKLALRWELRSGFAAWFMQQLAAGGGHGAGLLLDGLRRYEVAAVQRHAAGQGLPRSFLQADLDFILPGERTMAEQLLGDAEVITCTTEALAELPECGEAEVRLGHRSLFELALQFVGVSREARGSVVQLLSTAAAASPLHATARSKRWPSIKAGLEGIGLSAEAIGRCRQLVLQAAGEAEAALFRLRTMLAHVAPGRHPGGHRAVRPASAASLACLDELAQLIQYLQAWGVPSHSLLVDPLLAPHSEAFSGALFQCHLVQGSTGTTAVVAAGGRWNPLLKAAWARQSALSGSVAPMPPLHAVGATLNVDRLVHVAQASSRWRHPGSAPSVAGLPRLSQADVLVCSRGGGGLLKERMALARTLWEAGIAAELLPQAAPSLTDQFEYAQSRGIPWLVIIHASTFGAADTVRVKAMNARLEEDVSTSSLCTYLLNALHPHGPAAPAGSRTPHAPAARLGGDEGEAGGEGDEPSAHGGRERQRRGGRR